MIPYRPAHPQDYTKRRSYVRFDLAVKAMSAIGLLALGIAGWWFQVTSSSQRQLQEQRDREARQYLPALRALTELEGAASEIAERWSDPPEDQRERVALLATLSSRLNSAAIATAVVDADPSAFIELPDLARIDLTSKRQMFPVRSTAFLVADLLMLASLTDRRSAISQTTEFTIVFQEVDGRPLATVHDLSYPVHHDSVHLWRAWAEGTH